LANKDYTHLNSLGGRREADIFVKCIMNEYQKFNDQNKKNTSAGSTLAAHTK